MKTWPTLYKRGSSGKVQEWTISVSGDESLSQEPFGVIHVTHGQKDGKKQTTNDIVREGKNAGKKNSTTAVEQAMAEAEAKWTKQIERKGYVESLERASAGETDAEGGIAPMLAQPLDKAGHRMVFPGHAQRKLNGVRCIVQIQNGKVTLWSRQRTQIFGVPHIQKAYELAFAGVDGELLFDGELFRPGWPLQKISGYVRKKSETKAGYEELGHYVYDYPSHPGTWEERELALRANCSPTSKHPIYLVETLLVKSQDSIKPLHDQFVTEGFEGLIFRNIGARYQAGKRSYDLIKVKEFEEGEFRIVGFSEGRGKFEGLAMFACVTDEGKEFDCCSPGTLEERAEWFVRGPKCIGKNLTVKFFEWTVDGKPSHGVPVAIRDYE